MRLNEFEGTPWHVERVHRVEGDPRRDKRKCVYHYNGECNYRFGKCPGSAHCPYYAERYYNQEDECHMIYHEDLRYLQEAMAIAQSNSAKKRLKKEAEQERKEKERIQRRRDKKRGKKK